MARSMAVLTYAAILAAPTLATTEIHRLDGSHTGDDAGFAVAGAGDVNNDGFPDVIVGSPRHTVLPLFQSEEGKAVLYSGRDGTPIQTFLGTHDGGHLGWSVAGIDDVDGDGYRDIAIGVPDRQIAFWNGGVSVYSGRTGTLIYDVYTPYPVTDYARLGASLAAIDDLDGDGIGDFAAGAPLADTSDSNGHVFVDAGQVIVFSGVDGSEIRRLSGFESDAWFGHAVAAAGDVNQDGNPDLVVGEPRANLSSAIPTVDCGRVHLLSVFPGSSLQSHSGGLLNHGYQLGYAVAGGFDADGDGTPDFAAGAPYADTSATDAGQVRVYSGANGAPLWTRNGDLGNERLGFALSGLSDVDGDGRSEVLAGAPYSNIGSPLGVFQAGIVRILAGIDGATVDSQYHAEPGAHYGHSVAAIGDLDADGVADFVGGATDGDGDQNGSGFASIVVTEGCDALWYNYGSPLVGTLGIPALTIADDPVLCTSTTLFAGNSAGLTTTGILYLSAGETQIPLLGGILWVKPPLIPTVLTLPPGGVHIPVDIPCDPTLCGSRAFMQLLVADPGATQGVAFSYGLYTVLGS